MLIEQNINYCSVRLIRKDVKTDHFLLKIKLYFYEKYYFLPLHSVNLSGVIFVIKIISQ
jgi:hypothetical protein